jgi:hypothetical protein
LGDVVDLVEFIAYGSTKGSSKVILNAPQVFYKKSDKNVGKEATWSGL